MPIEVFLSPYIRIKKKEALELHWLGKMKQNKKSKKTYFFSFSNKSTLIVYMIWLILISFKIEKKRRFES